MTYSANRARGVLGCSTVSWCDLAMEFGIWNLELTILVLA